MCDGMPKNCFVEHISFNILRGDVRRLLSSHITMHRFVIAVVCAIFWFLNGMYSAVPSSSHESCKLTIRAVLIIIAGYIYRSALQTLFQTLFSKLTTILASQAPIAYTENRTHRAHRPHSRALLPSEFRRSLILRRSSIRAVRHAESHD